MSNIEHKNLDSIDRAILRALQTDSSLSQRELASRVSLSQNATWRRYKRLKEEGFITGQTIKIDAKSLGLGQTVFMLLKTDNHSINWLDEFRRSILTIENVVDFYRITGEYDYMLKVIAKDMSDFDFIYRQIIKEKHLNTVTSFVTMEAIADARNLPI